MKWRLIFTTLFATATWSLSSLAAADWDTGPCPGSGTAPCIEAEISGNAYHFNGTGDHAGEWHGLPTTGENFEFTGAFSWDCSGLSLECTTTWAGKIKKCQSLNGDWRIGLQINSANVSGDFLCSTNVFGGFPWYTNGDAVTPHCPFTDNCENFMVYEPDAPTYVSNFGQIDLTILGTPRIDGGHLHDMIFTPGPGASLGFNSDVVDCDEEELGCNLEGMLKLDNAASLGVH